MARAIASGTISFGMVSIPVRFYVATHSEQFRFHLIHAECGSRIRQQLYCPCDERVVQRSETVKGFEIRKGRYVTFTEEELRQLEAAASPAIEIEEFVPLDRVDPMYFADVHYLGPDQGAEKAYHLLAQAMRDMNRVALAQHVSRGKEQLVLIRPVDAGLALHALYYADEVRSLSDVDVGQDGKLPAKQVELARKLIADLSSDEFKPERYEDRYRERIARLVRQKSKGERITITAEKPKEAKVIDLMDALKQSLAREGRAARSATRGGRHGRARSRRKERPAA
jgi:DNA end-binding protein Ku